MKYKNHSSSTIIPITALPSRAKYSTKSLLKWRPLALAMLASGLTLSIPAAEADPLAWMDTSLAPEQRANLLIDAMSLSQKFQQLTGANPEIVPDLPECYGARHVTGIAALQIPTLRITNGPVGVGQNDCVDPSIKDLVDAGLRSPFAAFTDASSAKATALPSATTVAASFDPAVATIFGDVIGTEMLNLALHVFEAPGINMARLPILGRNFEYFGEDPYLTGIMGVAEVKAVQAKGLIGMAKHFVGNEQETNRMTIQETIDERTLHEIYLLPFEMAVKDGKTASVMCAYNYVNGVSSCENAYTLTDVLRTMWGFEGYVQSDFFATKSTVATLLAGMDHMMPIPQQWAPDLLQAALDASQITVADIDQALQRRYTQMFKYGIFERQPLEQTDIDYAAGGVKARAIGVQGGVLLQNNGALPIASTVENIVVIGKKSQVYAQQAVAGGVMVDQPMGAGGGSSDVVPTYTVTPVEGIKNVLADLGNTSAQITLILVDDANANATIDGANATTFENALNIAANADAVVVMAGTISEEGADRASFSDATGQTLADGTTPATGNSLDWYVACSNRIGAVDGSQTCSLPAGVQNTPANSQTVAMIKAILATSSNMATKTTLVLKDSAGVAMDPALVGVAGPSILEVWFPGQEDGHIVADLLFGVQNPSGKLPVTFPYVGQGFLDNISTLQYPGEIIDGQQTVEYTEKLNIGYRWYDTHAIQPAFPFGHGLSYTTFKISDLTVTPKVSDGTQPILVQFFVENTGKKYGAEVPQVYLEMPATANEPPKRLVGFKKIWLAPGKNWLDAGEKTKVEITIDPAASNHPLSVWDSATAQWKVVDGSYQIFVGNSSDNLLLQDTVKVHASHWPP